MPLSVSLVHSLSADRARAGAATALDTRGLPPKMENPGPSSALASASETVPTTRGEWLGRASEPATVFAPLFSNDKVVPTPWYLFLCAIFSYSRRRLAAVGGGWRRRRRRGGDDDVGGEARGFVKMRQESGRGRQRVVAAQWWW